MEAFASAFASLVRQRNRDALVQKGQLADAQTQGIIAVFSFRKDAGIRQEVDGRAGNLAVALFIKLLRCLALAELDAIAFAATTHLDLHLFAQRVNAGNTNAMQTAGNLVAAIAELAACVQHGHDNLDSRLLFLFHHIDGDTASIIDNSNAVILMDDDLNVAAIAGQRLVNTVVHNLIHQMVQTAGRGTADIHSRSFAYCFQAL